MQTKTHDTFPSQHQNRQPGHEAEMNPHPIFDNEACKPANKLLGKTAIITGGDSGIGRAVSVIFGKEGANVVIVHLKENDDANKTVDIVRSYGANCMAIAADVCNEESARDIVSRTVSEFGGLNILVNNAGVQYPQNSILDITMQQWQNTFETNIFSCFAMTKAALAHIRQGGSIINTASVTAFEGNPTLIDCSSTKGAIVSFTRSMSLSLAKQGIRVNAVAPGPVWTPLIVSSYSPEMVQTFGSTTPMQRAAQPYELVSAYVYLASDDSSNMSGQILHINGGTIIG